jgi:adenylosuccinate lyase
VIKRYSREIQNQLWSEEQMYKYWLDVELATLEAYKDAGTISEEDYETISAKAKVDLNRIHELEATTHHDILAFLAQINESIDDEASRFVHLGLTSSDVKDTALSLCMRDSGQIILKQLDKLQETLSILAKKHKNSIQMGRSHGVHAEPTTFGLKMLNFYDQIKRNSKVFEDCLMSASVGMLSGAVGTFANIEPKIEEQACLNMGLHVCKISNQVISRDRHANLVNAMSTIAGVIEGIATEIRHLQRTEVLEVEEPFYSGQKGSSAMPHKRNPWRSENLSGLARMMRSYAAACQQNICLWHERDMSHSSVERLALADSFILIDFMIERIDKILLDLKVYPENMRANMFKFGGISFSQQVLLKLIDKGLKREDAYNIIQGITLSVWNTTDGDFKAEVMQHDEITKHLSSDELEECFKPEAHLKHVEEIFNRVLVAVS